MLRGFSPCHSSWLQNAELEMLLTLARLPSTCDFQAVEGCVQFHNAPCLQFENRSFLYIRSSYGQIKLTQHSVGPRLCIPPNPLIHRNTAVMCQRLILFCVIYYIMHTTVIKRERVWVFLLVTCAYPSPHAQMTSSFLPVTQKPMFTALLCVSFWCSSGGGKR